VGLEGFFYWAVLSFFELVTLTPILTLLQPGLEKLRVFLNRVCGSLQYRLYYDMERDLVVHCNKAFTDEHVRYVSDRGFGVQALGICVPE
jgi:hypothetical protein